MESPKAVNAFLFTTVALCLLGALFLSICFRDAFIFLNYLGYLVSLFLGLAIAGIGVGIVVLPLMWILSLCGGPKIKGKR
jgi:hypothetical protein